MRNIAFADVTDDWRSLLAAFHDHPELLPLVEAELLGLEEALREVRDHKKRQRAATAMRQQATQELKAAIERGGLLATQLRAVAKGKIGPKNERLVQFRVAPMRKRSRKSAAEAAEATPSVEEPSGP